MSLAGSSSKTRFSVTGMTCTSCSNAIERALSTSPAVFTATVSSVLHSADVTYDSSKVSVAQLIDLIQSAGGYKATPQVSDAHRKVMLSVPQLRVSGSGGVALSDKLQAFWKAQPYVVSASVSVEDGQATVIYDTRKLQQTLHRPPTSSAAATKDSKKDGSSKKEGKQDKAAAAAASHSTGAAQLLVDAASAYVGVPITVVSASSAGPSKADQMMIEKQNTLRFYKRLLIFSALFGIPTLMVSMVLSYLPGMYPSVLFVFFIIF